MFSRLKFQNVAILGLKVIREAHMTLKKLSENLHSHVNFGGFFPLSSLCHREERNHWEIMRLRQGCKWNERSLNRGLNRGQGLGSDATFFGIHVRTSKSTRTFEFRTISVSVSPWRFLKRLRSSSFAIETNTHPAPTAHPPKISEIVCSS